MFVGEIGIDRDLFLYRLDYWELALIMRGYFRRHHPMYDAARLIAHQAHYCMGVARGQRVKTPQEWLPFSWERGTTQTDSDLPTDEEIEQMRRMMQEENRRAEGAET